MEHSSIFVAPALILICALAACSPGSHGPAAGDSAAGTIANSIAPAPPSSAPLDVPPVTTSASVPKPGSARVIGLEGLGDLRIGQPVPATGTWAGRGVQTSDECRTVTSPEYPGVYAIVADGKVRRITVGRRSDVKLVEGVGVGATELDVEKSFAGFRAEPHKYEQAPAKYLTAPNAANGSAALRFEIGRDGKVSLIHVGTMPELAYVEGCS